MNIQKTVLTLVVAFAVAGVQTAAYAKPKKDDDSAYSWGPWAVLVQPAAGPQVAAAPLAGLGAPGFGAGDAGFTPEVIPPNVTPTDDGDKGFGYALIQRRVSLFGGPTGLSTYPTGFQNATPTLAPIPFDGGGVFDLTITSNTAIPLAQIFSAAEYSNPTVIDLGSGFPGGIDAVSLWDSNTSAESGSVTNILIEGITLSVGGVPFAFGRSTYTTGPTDLAAGVGHDAGFGFDGTTAYFIYGNTTSFDDLNALAGTVEANYFGGTLASGSFVDIGVNFTDGSWDGIWNGGNDEAVTAEVDVYGVSNLSGKVGFSASGVINGANIVSTDIMTTTTGATISGAVNGSFFGADAGVLAGVVNVDKTVAGIDGYDGNYQDLFVTVKVPEEPSLR